MVISSRPKKRRTNSLVRPTTMIPAEMSNIEPRYSVDNLPFAVRAPAKIRSKPVDAASQRTVSPKLSTMMGPWMAVSSPPWENTKQAATNSAATAIDNHARGI